MLQQREMQRGGGQCNNSQFHSILVVMPEKKGDLVVNKMFSFWVFDNISHSILKFLSQNEYMFAECMSMRSRVYNVWLSNY